MSRDAGRSPQDALSRRVGELQMLHETAVRLTSILDVRALLPEMVEQLRRVLEVEIVSIMLLDPDGRSLRIAAAAGLPPDIVETARVIIGEGISGHVAQNGEPALIQDMSADARWGRSPYHDQYTTESLICVPLKVGDRVLGVINVNNKPSGEVLDEQDLALVTIFSAQAVLALENSRLYGNLEEEVARVAAELQRKNVELRRVQEFNESILRHMGSGLVTLDLDGKITMINRSAEVMLSVPHPMPSDETLETLVGDEAAERFRDGPEGEGWDVGAGRAEVVAKSRHGREVLVGYSSSELPDATGALVGRIVLFRDLTDLKKMEAELVRMDRMASLGYLGAGIAHEIRNPLAAMRFNLDFLREQGEDSPELDVIVSSVERLDGLVKELLRFARPQRPAFRAEGLGRAVSSVAALIAQQASTQGVDLQLDLDEDLPDALIDLPQVEQVILNVALNGIQAMPDGGRLSIATRKKPGDDSVGQILISDDGRGISAEQAANIFDPFFTSREEGTGLGLAVAQRIVEDHGGSIDVAVEPVGDESGATFVLCFPLAPEPSPESLEEG